MASLPPGLSPERLTDLLREAGVLAGGRVTTVEAERARDTLISRIVHLRLTCAGADAGDAWRIDLATDDLACMLALHCFPEWRARYERERLERYHARLLEHGVRDDDLAALWQDYRLSVLGTITTPLWQANHGIPPWVWWNHLERIFRAVDDLDCLALLG